MDTTVGAGAAPGGNPVDVVLVDDDPTALRILESILRSDGHAVRSYRDPVEALREMVRRPPDVLVADWLMPGMDGPDLLREVRASASLQGTYCVLVTAHDARGRKVAGLLVGADDYLTKPVSEMELLARIRVGVRIRRLERQHMLLATAVTLGHEVNNPLTGVLGFVDILRGQILAGEAERALETLARMEESAERIRRVVSRFLAQEVPRFKEYVPGTPMIDLGKTGDIHQDP
ncbi:MAG: response regulator [Planctomycetaceae bacterium]|nr:response regulator [Planctomycetota bacterium]NUN52420.1 response regulator [Planctomycetaceae bacterium]